MNIITICNYFTGKFRKCYFTKGSCKPVLVVKLNFNLSKKYTILSPLEMKIRKEIECLSKTMILQPNVVDHEHFKILKVFII